MRILSLITHFSHIPAWETATTRIDQIDPNWKQRSRLSQARFLVRIALQWDRIVFFYDTQLPFLFWMLYLLRYWHNPRQRMIFTTWLYDASPLPARLKITKAEIRLWIGRVYFWVFTRLFRVIIVHSSAEVSAYAKMFGVPPSRFAFIPYFVRSDALADATLPKQIGTDYVLASGRSRDFTTFVEAVRNLPVHSVLVGGEPDRAKVGVDLPPNLEAHFEIPFDEYRSWIAGSTIFVVPLRADRPMRSLGQVATFEAIAHHVPVIAARTFHLSDYFTDNEILFYEPGDVAGLRQAIQQLMADPAQRQELARKAYERMMTKFTPQAYVQSLLALCTQP